MKIFLFLFIFLPSLLSAQKIQGEAQYEIRTIYKGEEYNAKFITITYKNGMYRSVEKDSTGKIISEYSGNRKDSALYRIDRETQMIFRLPWVEVDRNTRDTNSVISQTGRDSLMCGFKCTEYKVTNKIGFTTLWMTLDPRADGFEMFYPGMKGVPFLMQTVAFNVDMTIRVTKYLDRKVTDKELALPKGYKIE